MKKDMDSAAAKYNRELAQLKRENENIKKQFQETTLKSNSQVTQINAAKQELSADLQASEQEKKQLASELN